MLAVPLLYLRFNTGHLLRRKIVAQLIEEFLRWPP